MALLHLTNVLVRVHVQLYIYQVVEPVLCVLQVTWYAAMEETDSSASVSHLLVNKGQVLEEVLIYTVHYYRQYDFPSI